ncbi:MAG: ATP-binding protein [Pseudomonadota bacterium]
MICWLYSAFNSILVRVFALAAGTILLLIAATAVVFQTPLSDRFFDQSLQANARPMAQLVWLLETSSRTAEPAILSTYNGGSQIADITPDFMFEPDEDRDAKGILVNSAGEGYADFSERDIRSKVLRFSDLNPVLPNGQSAPYTAASALQVSIRLKDDRVLNVWLAPSGLITGRQNAFGFFFGSLAFCTLMVSLGVYLLIMRPVRLLERDAELVGLAETSVPITETGPRELRRLVAALNRMRSRLSGMIREREQIMVAIAHDIRTGLTKLRLRIENQSDVQDPNIERDLGQMESLISDMLAYARAESPVIEHELIELRGFLLGLAQAAPFDVEVWQDNPQDDFAIAGSKIGMTRLFENLLENARRYGGGWVGLKIQRTSQDLAIAIEDNGPGIAPEELEYVFDPFYRAERSRNRATGGTGLGLGIARAIAHSHGAQISLTNRSEGGLKTTVTFPVMLRT